MKTNRIEYLLKPASYLFIILSLVFGLIINIFPFYTRFLWMPDILGLMILFWVSREPYKINIGIAFMLGIIMDVKFGSLFGTTALVYSILAFAAHSLHARLKHFSFTIQGLHFLPILFLVQIIVFAINIIQGNYINNATYWLKPIIEALIWPILANILLIPQKLSNNIDHTRPI